MGKTFEQNADGRISELQEKVRHLEQERNAAMSQINKLQAALREKEVGVQPESSEQEEAGSAHLILESILENVPDGLAICDLDGRITYCSQEGIKMSGMSPEEMSGCTPEERRLGMTLYKPDGSTPADIDEMPLVQVLRTGKPVMNRELLIRHRDGKEIPIRSNAAPIRNREGNLIGAIHLWRDVSEQKCTEKALQKSHEKFRTFFQTTPVLTTVSTVKEGRILDVNRAFETVTGYTRDEAIGKTSYELNIWRRPEDRDRFGEILKNDTPLREEEAEITAKSGEKRTVLISAETIELAGEKCIIASAQDITPRKQSEERLRALVAASSDVLYRMSPDWKEMRQLNSESFLAQTIEPNPNWLQEYILPEDQAYVIAIIEKAIRTKSVFELEHRVRRADGGLGWTYSRAVPILDAEGDIIEWFGAASDITEARQVQQALAESEERYRTLFTNMTEGFALGEPILDEEGRPENFRFLEINEAFEEQSGLSAKVLGHPASVVLPNLESYWIEIYCNVAMGGEPVRFEQFNRDTNRWFDVYCYRPAEGRFAILFRDVTKSRSVHETLSKSEERLQMALEASQMGVWELNLGDKSATRTLELDRIFGYEDLLPKWTYELFLEHVLPEDREEVDQKFQAAISTGRPWHFECRIRRIDGQIRWIETQGRVYLDESGETRRMVGLVADITDRKRAEEALRVSEERFRVAVKNSTFIPSQTDKELRYRWIYNPHPDFDASAVIGKRDLEIDDSAGAHALQELKQRVLESGCGERETIEFQRSDGVRIYDFIVEPLYDFSGKVDGLTSAAFDVTEKKRAEKELKRAKKAAEEANRAKSEFLANMSHEIRTPMTVFMAAIEHLLQIDRDPDRRHVLGMADQSAKRLRSLIDDILDFSRIEARKVEIEETPFDLRECVRQTVELFALPAREKGLRLEAEIAPEVPRIATGDPHRLGQILINLIGNAVKFTHEGEVRVCVRPRCDVLEFSVADTGIGIPEDKLALLFQSFSQVDASFARQYGGTGLGLAISKGLVELMGGEISVRSHKREGSVFTFSLPLKTVEPSRPAPAEALPEAPAETQSAVRILLAEDDPMIREMITMMLSRKGWQIDVAETGVEALDKWKSGTFDVIFMDLQMPQMNGLEATRRIRAKEAGGEKQTCIIGLTAHARREITDECLQAGMDRVLTKPVQIKDLFSAIEGCLPG